MEDKNSKEEKGNSQSGEMTFLEHLEEFRWHLVRSVIALFVLTTLAFINKNFVFDTIILAPSKLDFWTYRKLCGLSDQIQLGSGLCVEEMGFRLSNIHMAGQFTQHILVSVMVGLILGFPYLTFEIWRFVQPAMSRGEKWKTRGFLFVTTLLFLMGALFGYFLLTPMSVQFLGHYRVSETIQNAITLKSYVTTVSAVTFATALIFEMPVAVYFLSRMGLVTPSLMRSYRKHALVVVLLLSAIITPPDVTSQILLGIPFFLLYELSILISSVVRKRKLKEEQKNE